jgi:pimeloyl-ACP methyl ester carboxylesterase
MAFLFNDQNFSFQTLRALGYAPYGGAGIGEVVSTAGRIPDGDETAWYTQWRTLAERIHADADRSAAQGHFVSAREAYLRANVLIEQRMSSSTQLRSTFHWGMWVLGADSPVAVVRAIGPYTMEGYAPLITCPTLVLEGEIDQPMHLLGSPSKLYEALRCPKAYHLFPEAEGGGQHCQVGAVTKLHQVVFNWLDTALAAVGGVPGLV